ncbi:MAG: LytTR family DNA-binding domain-containing protein [Polaribacter sp.]
MNKTIVKEITKIPVHLLFWAIVWFFFYIFFSAGSSNQSFIFWFSSILSIVSIVTSYSFMYQIIPDYLIQKKYSQFTLYTIYAFLFSMCVVCRETITNFEEKLPSQLFIRSYRSFIVAFRKVNSYTNEFLEIKDKTVSISRSYKESVLDKLADV